MPGRVKMIEITNEENFQSVDKAWSHVYESTRKRPDTEIVQNVVTGNETGATGYAVQG